MQTYTHKTKTYLTKRLALALSMLALITAACNRDSVVTNSGSSNTTGTPATTTAAPATGTAPAAGASAPAVTGATPFVLATPMQGTVNTTANGTLTSNGITASGNDGPQGEGMPRHIGDFPVQLSAAKKAPTPEPDAFAPRPTPTIEIVNGKIKQQWPAPAEALAMKNPLAATPENIAKGREWYNQRCLDCHGRLGQGNGWMGANLKRDGQPLVPTNLASQVVQANSDGELFWKITNGRSPMPANRIRFEDEQRWQMVLFMRTFKAAK